MIEKTNQYNNELAPEKIQNLYEKEFMNLRGVAWNVVRLDDDTPDGWRSVNLDDDEKFIFNP